MRTVAVPPPPPPDWGLDCEPEPDPPPLPLPLPLELLSEVLFAAPEAPELPFEAGAADWVRATATASSLSDWATGCSASDCSTVTSS